MQNSTPKLRINPGAVRWQHYALQLSHNSKKKKKTQFDDMDVYGINKYCLINQKNYLNLYFCCIITSDQVYLNCSYFVLRIKYWHPWLYLGVLNATTEVLFTEGGQ